MILINDSGTTATACLRLSNHILTTLPPLLLPSLSHYNLSHMCLSQMRFNTMFNGTHRGAVSMPEWNDIESIPIEAPTSSKPLQKQSNGWFQSMSMIGAHPGHSSYYTLIIYKHNVTHTSRAAV